MQPETLIQRIEMAERRLETLQRLAENLSPEQQGLVAQALAELRAVKGELRRQSEESPVARQGTSAQDTESAQANRLLRTLLDTMPIGVIVCDADGALLMTNPPGEAILGGHVYGSARAPQRAYTSYYPDGSPFPAEEMPLVRAVERKEIVRNVEILIRRGDGSERTILAGAAPVLDARGRVVSAVTVFQDITERKQAEEERERLLDENRRQREFLERLVDVAPVGIAVVRGPDHRFEMVNPYFQAISGTPDVPMVGRPLAKVFPDLPARGAIEFVETAYRTRQTVSIREREAAVGPGREQTYWNVDHVPLRSPDGDVESVLLLASEVTEHVRHRKQIEELAAALQSERNILQIIMENTRAHLVYLDPEFNFVAVNSTYVQGCGYSREELIGRNHFALFPDAENQAIFERVRDTGEPVEFHAKLFEYPARPELGTTYWDWTLAPVKGADGQTAGLVLSLMDVTQQIRAQAEIESLARFPGENPNPVLRVTRDGTILYANPGSAPLLAHWGVQVGQQAPDEWQRRIAGALDAGVGQVVEAPCDGRTFSLTITPRTEKGYANLYALDITELKRAEEALRESEGKLQAVFNTLPVGVSILDGDRNIVKQNLALERILEVPAQGLANKQYVNRTYVRADGTPMPAEEFPSVRACKERRSVQDVEIGIVTEDGKTVWTNVSAVPVSFSDWKVVVTTVDITDLKTAQQVLQHYTDRLRMLHEADQAILAARSEEEIAAAAIRHMPQLLDCVRASVILLDREADEVSLLTVHTQGETRLGKGWRSPIYAEWAEMIETLGRGEIYVVEDLEEFASSFVVEALQSERVCTCTYVPLIVQGQLVGALGLGMCAPGPLTAEQKEIALEIATELAIGIQQARLHAHVQRHADELEEEVLKRTQALRASEARFRAIFEGAGIGIALVDENGRVEESNPALQGLLGYGAAELRGMPFTTFSHADEAQSSAELFKELLAEDAADRYKKERRYVRKDGQLRWGNLTASVVRKSAGSPQFAVVMVEDTTEQKRAHEALLQSEKLAVTGRLAASLAHEINNPLQSVIGCLELVEESLAEGKDPVRFLQLATEELERAASIVAQLRDLNRPSKPEEREPTDVNALVRYVLTLTKKQCQKRQVEVVCEAAEGLPLLGLVPDRIEQVFLNLVLNAVEAMPHGGRLEMRTSPTAEPPGVCISFADSGHGIAADVLPHLFDPFYTTKPDGLGLGLYISHHIVEEHRGHIEVESRAEEGATFTVWLPE
jgi:PAS domain S-box-containing protein